ncbi:NAD(P)/FAD-dependent oxidoreductase [Arenicella xantha]|uniref:Flavin-dependent dehydrogenase n=1 Tax=Arenicella xantha TaxID=644221 RepID=A0A395JTA7_9GAMM|nr:tryptophan 7-halogenase [Arenicella xantha]RBP53726.1 flavin-dependent dehydrogenase [Arenicella xantha]
MSVIHKDVIIAGGGLAGLTLARQLKQTKPELDILVVERNQFPVPEKTAKVGESTVEIGSRYLTYTLGLREHFSERHLRKHGLRCFFGTPQSDFAQQDELGVSELFGIPTYQIDRGAIENYLHTSVSADGVEVLDGVTTKHLDVSGELKQLTVTNGAREQRFSSRWLIDAAGRQALIKNQLGLQQDSGHKGNALWFRIDKQVKLDDWSSDADWRARIKQAGTRWLSTNHLMGPGYWIWVIPLDNGATSFGMVMDDQALAAGDFSCFEATFAWLQQHHPQCAASIEGARILDYVVINDYSHGCQQMFSDLGWGVTGESGVFADPFYSPGSDFIAFNNTFISELVGDSFSGHDIRLKSRVFESMNQSFFASTLSLYNGEYGGFGDRRMMSLKLVWDYAYYWGVLSLLFFRNAVTDVTLMRSLNPNLREAQALNERVQGEFRQRAKQRIVLPAQGLFMNQFEVPCLKQFSRVLEDDSLDVSHSLANNVALLQRLAAHTIDMLGANPSQQISDDECAVLGDYRRSVLA